MRQFCRTTGLLVFLLAVVVVFSLVGVASTEEDVTLTLLVNHSNSPWNDLRDSAVQQEIKRVTGVTLELIEVDDNQLQIILAGGDLPDMVRVSPAKFGKALVEGNHVLALDELIETHGQDMLETIPETLEFVRDQWSKQYEYIGKDGKIYFIPVQVGLDGMGIENSMDVILRWDYYKEIGAPEINNEDDLLNVLAQMVQNHPTTEAGKKVYGVSMWNDWQNWMYNVPMYCFTGHESKEPFALSVDPGSSYVKNYSDEDGLYWRTVRFYYRANRMGLLDPDAFTMKYADYEAKATAGQILYGPANWPFQKFNQQHNHEAKGFMSVPLGPGNYQWNGNMAYLGWSGTCFAITTDCKYPEKAMEVMNYLWSYDGARTLYNGVEGVHWNIVDGKPVLTAETIEAYTKADQAWENTCIDLDYNIIGLSPFTVHPEDGEPLSLFRTAQVYKTALNPLFKDYSDFYGVSYPAEVFQKRLEAGINKNKSGVNQLASSLPFLPPQTNEEKRTVEKVRELMSRYAAKCILARSDEEFEALKAEAIKAFEQTGIGEYFQRRYQWYEEAKEAAKAFMQ